MRAFVQKEKTTQPSKPTNSMRHIGELGIEGQLMTQPNSQVQRACACGGGCPMCRADQSTETSNAVDNVLRSHGEPLDPSLQEYFGQELRSDFSRVRIHRDAEAAESAQMLRARAFTYGDHVVFAAGRYQPETLEGEGLLTHELWHHVQQRRGLTADLSKESDQALEKEARSVAAGLPVPNLRIAGSETPALQCGPQLEAFMDAFLEANDDPGFRLPRTDPRLPAVVRDDFGAVILRGTRTPLVDLGGLPRGAGGEVLNDVVHALQGMRGGIPAQVGPGNLPMGAPRDREIIRNVAERRPVVRFSGNQLRVYLQQPTSMGPVIVRVRISDESGLLRSALSRLGTERGPNVNQVERAVTELVGEALVSPPDNGWFVSRGSTLPSAIRGSLTQGGAMPSVWPWSPDAERGPAVRTARAATTAGTTEPVSRPAPALNVPQPILPLGMSTATDFTYEFVYSRVMPDGNVGLELRWQMADDFNQALRAQGRNPLPTSGRLWIVLDPAGNVVQTNGSNLPATLERSLARQAVASAPASITNPRPGQGMVAGMRWIGRLLLIRAIAEGIESVINAPPGERLQTATGVAGGMAIPHIVCNLTLGAGGLPGIICHVVAGAVGSEVGRVAGQVLSDLPMTPTQLPGMRIPGGRLSEQMDRDRRAVRPTIGNLPAPTSPSITSGGAVSDIGSPGGRALANIISNAGTMNLQNAREIARLIEGALEQAVAGRPNLLVSVESTGNDEQLFPVVLPLSAHFPDGGRFEIRGFEVRLLMILTRSLVH